MECLVRHTHISGVSTWHLNRRSTPWDFGNQCSCSWWTQWLGWRLYMFYQAINLGMCINAIIILCSKYGMIKLFNLYYFLTRKWEGMVSVPVLDIHILLDARLSFQPWLPFSYKEYLLSIAAWWNPWDSFGIYPRASSVTLLLSSDNSSTFHWSLDLWVCHVCPHCQERDLEFLLKKSHDHFICSPRGLTPRML